jgi:hypothetical protein
LIIIRDMCKQKRNVYLLGLASHTLYVCSMPWVTAATDFKGCASNNHIYTALVAKVLHAKIIKFRTWYHPPICCIINFKVHICIDPNFMVHIRTDRIYYVTEISVQHRQFISQMYIINFFLNSAPEYSSRKYCKS